MDHHLDKTGQNFLNDLDKKLWTAADKLRTTQDAAQYKHAVLGLFFVTLSGELKLNNKEVA